MYNTMIKRTKIVIKSGDILREENVDAICIPMNSDGKMAGGASLAVKELGGVEIEKELQSRKPLRLGRAVATSAGTLFYKKVIHGIIMPHVAAKSTSEELVSSAIQSALGLCDSEGIRSLALTYFATGYGGWSPARSSDIMLKSAISYVTTGTSIKEIRFVAHEKVFGAFQKSLLNALFSNMQPKISPAILVVDVIKDFFGPDRLIHEQEGKNLCSSINRLLSSARACKVPIIFLNDSHENEKDWEFTRTLVHALKGSEGSHIIDGIDYQGEKIVEKSRYDGFHHTELEDILKNLEVNVVILCGVQTHVCVLLTALSAFYRGFRPIIVRDCSSSSTKDKHGFGLWYLETYGGDTADSDDIEVLIQMWKKD